MLDIRVALGRKILCLAVIFNSILSMLFAGNILYVFYITGSKWRHYWPYLLDESLLWFTVIASFLNIIAAKILGNVDLKRIKFHHYFYGFIAIIVSFIFMVMFAPAYLSTLLMPTSISDAYGSASILISAAFFSVYGGMTLIIDDIQDLSLRLGRALNALKRKLHRFRRPLEMLHFCCCITSIYVTLGIFFWALANGFYFGGLMLPEISAGIFTLNLLITSIWGLGMIKKRFWLMNFYADSQRKSYSSPIKNS